MLKVLFALFILGLAVLAVSIGILILSEVRLDDLPRNPVNILLIAEKKNLGETKDISQAGILVGALMVGIPVITAGFLYWRDR
jgi:hypothetical protein